MTVDGTRLSFVACGTVLSNEKAALPERLKQLHQGLSEVVRDLCPDEAAEKLIHLVESLEDHDDVQNVFVNFEVSDAAMAKAGA